MSCFWRDGDKFAGPQFYRTLTPLIPVDGPAHSRKLLYHQPLRRCPLTWSQSCWIDVRSLSAGSTAATVASSQLSATSFAINVRNRAVLRNLIVPTVEPSSRGPRPATVTWSTENASLEDRPRRAPVDWASGSEYVLLFQKRAVEKAKALWEPIWVELGR